MKNVFNGIRIKTREILLDLWIVFDITPNECHCQRRAHRRAEGREKVADSTMGI